MNRRIKVLQTFALPLGYRADRQAINAQYRGAPSQVKPTLLPKPRPPRYPPAGAPPYPLNFFTPNPYATSIRYQDDNGTINYEGLQIEAAGP